MDLKFSVPGPHPSVWLGELSVCAVSIICARCRPASAAWRHEHLETASADELGNVKCQHLQSAWFPHDRRPVISVMLAAAVSTSFPLCTLCMDLCGIMHFSLSLCLSLHSYQLSNQVHIVTEAPCGLRGCKNWPAPFPGRMSYKATKPGLVSVLYLSIHYMVLLFIRATFYVLLVFIAMCAVFWLFWLSYQYLPSDWL